MLEHGKMQLKNARRRNEPGTVLYEIYGERRATWRNFKNSSATLQRKYPGRQTCVPGHRRRRALKRSSVVRRFAHAPGCTIVPTVDGGQDFPMYTMRSGSSFQILPLLIC